MKVEEINEKLFGKWIPVNAEILGLNLDNPYKIKINDIQSQPELINTKTGKILKGEILDGYVVYRFNGINRKRSRVILSTYSKQLDIDKFNDINNYCIDHINRNRLDDSLQNLRLTTISNNIKNRNSTTKNRYTYYFKYNINGNLIWKKLADDLSQKEIKYIQGRIRDYGEQPNKFGFYYKIKSQYLIDLENKYGDINKLQYPWYKCVESSDYIINSIGIVKNTKTNKICTQSEDSHGYMKVCINRKQYFVHRLLMEAVLNKKLDRKEIIDHIDTNIKNNSIENLRLTTSKGNMNNVNTKNKLGKKIAQIDILTQKQLNTFNSITEAAQYLGKKSISTIGKAARGIQSQAYGYIWKFI